LLPVSEIDLPTRRVGFIINPIAGMEALLDSKEQMEKLF
jgi:hypothetical protein